MADQLDAQAYNYLSFSRSESAGKSGEFKNSLRAGEEAPDFVLPSLDRSPVRLSSFRDKAHVLLEFGSITWPPFVGEVSPLNELYRRFRSRGFEFFTVYVREPHPGEHYGPHQDFEQKLRFARECRDQDGIQTPILIDDLDGTVHRCYGTMPNMIYIIDRSGKIAYKAMWTDHEEIASVLANLALADELQAKGVRVKPSYTEKINYVPAQYGEGIREKVFNRAGPQAWADYGKVFPGSTK